VCIIKGAFINDGIQITIDYRHQNKYTHVYHQPIESTHDILHEIGNAHFTSGFDAKADHWQTPTNPSHKWLTALICDNVKNFTV
jgi:hypothetical protein